MYNVKSLFKVEILFKYVDFVSICINYALLQASYKQAGCRGMCGLEVVSDQGRPQGGVGGGTPPRKLRCQECFMFKFAK